MNSTNDPASTVLVIGAGMAGITAARTLSDAGLRPIVLDKGRAPGGRMATRTVGEARFDHGAQHFAARTGAFIDVVDELASAGIVHRWYDAGSVERPNPRYVGTSGMRSIVAHLAADLDVRTSTEVDAVERTESGVRAVIDGRVVAAGRAAVVTAPLPQLIALLDRGRVAIPPGTRSHLDGIQYNATLAVMAQLDAPSGLSDGYRSFENGSVAWLADNHHKGVSAVPAVTIHSSPTFAAEFLESDPTEWSKLLIDAAAHHLVSTVTSFKTHRWRYAEPQRTLDSGAIILDDGAPVVLAGEVFAGAKVEGAHASGRAGANSLLEVL